MSTTAFILFLVSALLLGWMIGWWSAMFAIRRAYDKGRGPW